MCRQEMAKVAVLLVEQEGSQLLPEIPLRSEPIVVLKLEESAPTAEQKLERLEPILVA